LDAERPYHIPVLVKESIDALSIRPDGIYVDATVGGGGHFREIVSRLDKRGTAVGIDRDPAAIAWCRTQVRGGEASVVLEQSEFSSFDEVLARHGIGAIDGLLLDLGVSSRQIDSEERGFSYMKQSPLDMRMDPESGDSAAVFCARTTEYDLAHVLRAYGEITNPLRMARAIKQCGTRQPLATSYDLVACLRKEYGPMFPVKVIAKVFQALRIAVNGELDELDACLRKAVLHVKEGGRIAVISYHSLEDRIVKNFFRDNEQGCTCPRVLARCICGKKILLKRLNKKVIIPSPIEVRSNPRSRSARMRVAQKVS
jgi:16S rRNA (cytosine1402-N4)-methyltransferase